MGSHELPDNSETSGQGPEVIILIPSTNYPKFLVFDMREGSSGPTFFTADWQKLLPKNASDDMRKELTSNIDLVHRHAAGRITRMTNDVLRTVRPELPAIRSYFYYVAHDNTDFFNSDEWQDIAEELKDKFDLEKVKGKIGTILNHGYGNLLKKLIAGDNEAVAATLWEKPS